MISWFELESAKQIAYIDAIGNNNNNNNNKLRKCLRCK